MTSDIDIHHLNLKPFESSKILVENPFKKCVFGTFWAIDTLYIYIYIYNLFIYLGEKTIMLKKEEIL